MRALVSGATWLVCLAGAAVPAACDRTVADGARAVGARGDSAALASLPPALDSAFAVRAVLTPEALRDTAAVTCERLAKADTIQVRRRLRARLADGSRTVLFVRAARGTIRRVELVRRERAGSQRGFIWDASTDAAQSVEWRAGVPRPEVTTLPRGGPVPGALRALGRRLLDLPCARGA